MKDVANKKQEMILDISIFSSSYYFAQLAYFMRGFLNARILGPGMYGLWAALNILYSFGFCPTLGVLSGMSREIPYSIGKGEYDRADKIRANAFGFSLIASIIASVLIIVASLFFRDSLGLAGLVGIVTISVLIVIQNVINFYEMALSSVRRFSIIAAANMLFPMISVVLTLILVTRWNIYGIYIVAVLIPLAISLFFHFKARYRPSLRLDLKESFRLIKIGFPLMSLYLFPVILFTIDRMLILKFLGTTELGYYALGLLICQVLFYLPAVVGLVVEPRLFHKYGESGKVDDLKKYLFVPTKAMGVLLPLLIAIVYFIASFIIRHLLTQYTASLTPLFILLFGRFFLLVSPTTKSFLMAINKQHKMMYFYLVAILLSFALDSLVLKLGFGINAVAFTTAVVSFLLGTSLFIYALGFYWGKWFTRFMKCFKLYAPYMYILGATAVLDLIFKNSGVFFHDLALVFLKITILVTLSAPFILYLNKQIGLMKEAILLLKSKLSALSIGGVNQAQI